MPDFDYPYFDGLLIQIALPRLYKHKPIYYVALYHELGHFVDIHFNITESTFITNPVASGTPPQILEMQKSYRREFFADLFAAAYVGEANYKLLNEIAANAAGSLSHPPTLNRVELARDFIGGNSNPIIDMFQNVLSLLKLPKLTKNYESPDIKKSFNNIRPYMIKNDLELHGILESSWFHLSEALKSKDSPWVHLDEAKIHCIINDLTEKSLRNYSIQESWSNGTST